MKRSTLASRFLGDWQPAPLPARGPDGMIPSGPPPDRRGLPVVDPPSLCEAGPCRRYHRIVSVLETADPLDGSKLAPSTQITRACYPAPGIEVELSEHPIMQCSHWDPRPRPWRDQAKQQWLKSPAGKDFRAGMQAYEEASGLVDGDDDPSNDTGNRSEP